MDIRYLINADGSPFDAFELCTLRAKLDSLNDSDRIDYRDRNASFIVDHNAAKLLIVSGPGTGKSYLFLKRIDSWFKSDPTAKIVVTTFVRKLVSDLQSDIHGDTHLTDEQKNSTLVSTLHRLARSIVETNCGTKSWPFEKYIRIIDQSWKDVIWSDVICLASIEAKDDYKWGAFEKQLHNVCFRTDGQWKEITHWYYELCKYYNAAGFADLVIRARDALQEQPELVEAAYFIIDEYQDFNEAENQLINALTSKSKGLLVVGDDEQVLYEKLKSGKATLIRGLYHERGVVNAMLPFCGRCNYHTTKAAEHFISQSDDKARIEKIYLPLTSHKDTPKIQVVACAGPSTAIDYISKFLEEHKGDIEQRVQDLKQGTKKDAFLLILSPVRGAKFMGKEASEQLRGLLAPYRIEGQQFSNDFYKLLTYYSVAKNPRANYLFRKILHFENIKQERIVELIRNAISGNLKLYELAAPEIKESMKKCTEIKDILDKSTEMSPSLSRIQELIGTLNVEALMIDLKRRPIIDINFSSLEETIDDEAEISESQAGHMNAVELLTIVGAKGLSADYVIILGLDNVNMCYTTQNAFYVAMTRARQELHLLTTLKAGGATSAHIYLDRLPCDNIEFKSYRKSDRTLITYKSSREFKDYIGKLSYMSRIKH